MTINRLNQDVTYLPAFRNLLINGAMQVAQRGTSTASITTGSNYVTDRWKFQLSSFGTWTVSQETDAPTGSGFNKSTKVLCTTAAASPSAGSFLLFNQTLEGQNLQAIRKGTSNAQQLTLQFWVKANVTGTYVVELRDQDNTRQVSASYTINASNTWEKKTIVFPADTTGTLDNDNNLSLFPIWWLGAGTDFTSGTLATTWASGTNANKAVGQTNLAAATNNYWQVTGVQLEVGAVATPFEFKPFDQDLRECQRYYYKPDLGLQFIAAHYSNTNILGTLYAPVKFRAAVTWENTTTTTVQIIDSSGSTVNTTSIVVAQSNLDAPDVIVTATGYTGTGAARVLYNNGFAISAEL